MDHQGLFSDLWRCALGIWRQTRRFWPVFGGIGGQGFPSARGRARLRFFGLCRGTSRPRLRRCLLVLLSRSWDGPRAGDGFRSGGGRPRWRRLFLAASSRLRSSLRVVMLGGLLPPRFRCPRGLPLRGEVPSGCWRIGSRPATAGPQRSNLGDLRTSPDSKTPSTGSHGETKTGNTARGQASPGSTLRVAS